MKIPILSLKEWCVVREGEILAGPLNLDCFAREITVFMGPSGVGKTTLLLSLLGYTEEGLVITGRRFQDGEELAPGKVLRGINAYVPQHLPFNPNWEVGSFLCRLPWGERRWWHVLWPETPSRKARVKAVLAQLGISTRMHATVAELSGGEIQRAALAQLLLIKPEFFVGDEMSSGLDPGIAQWVLSQCKTIIDTSGGAAALASHDVHAALQIGDQIVILWPAKTGEPPWTIRRQSRYWDLDALHALLCIARWSKEFEDSPAVWHFLSLLRRIDNGIKNDIGRVGLIGNDGCLTNYSETDCPPDIKNKIQNDRCLPVRIEEGERTLVGISWPTKGNSVPQAIFADVR